MVAVLAIALKDLQLLFRVKEAWFFTLCWPLIVAVVFGSLFGGGGSGPSRMFIAITDEDQTPASKQFVDALAKREGFDVLRTSVTEATDLVRRGRRVGAIRIPTGFGEASGRLFVGDPPRVELLIDPSRQAETAMLQGFLLEQAAGRMQTLFSASPEGRSRITTMPEDVKKQPGAFAGQADLQSMLGSLDAFLGKQAQAAPPAGIPPAGAPVTGRSAAPAGGGRRGAFGVRPASPGLLVLAILVVPLGFVGLMMLVASLGCTEEGASGAGWALMMPMSMLGGGMIPLAVMPAWILPFSYASPVRWAIISFEGAIWRGFSLAEMVVPCAILIGIGAIAFAVGARRFRATLA